MTPQQKPFVPAAGTDASVMSGDVVYTNSNLQQQQQPNGSHKQPLPIAVARRVTPSSLAECGARLRAGDLVAFPTETVFGLGCHALDPNAVQKVFDAKERPLTDPLIVHVAKAEDALVLWEQEQQEQPINHEGMISKIEILEILCQAFWPGPLTLVAKAAPHVPSILMAGTGFVACRCPSHPLAQALIQHAQVPIAAPSANKFGHVSPTQPDHVMDDLGQEDVWILAEDEVDEESNNNDNTSQPRDKISCQVGVESTVAKLEELSVHNKDNHQYALTILRQGAISVQDLQLALQKAGISENIVSVATLSTRMVEETEATVAPGQLIKHYSPRIPSFLVSPTLYQNTNANGDDKDTAMMMDSFMKGSIVLDFGGRLAAWKAVARHYRDLSPSGDSAQAAQCVFEALRWAERVDDDNNNDGSNENEARPSQFIVFPQVVVATNKNDEDVKIHQHDALTLALNDRLTRAASGVVLDSVASLHEHISMQQ